MKHNEITREILSMSKRKDFFRNLHDRYNFDFEGRIYFFRIDGKFTLNTVKNLAKENGFRDSATCLIFTALTSQVKEKKLRAFGAVLVNLYNNSFKTVFLPECDWYCRKSDFNDLRKRDDIISFGIIQDNKDLKNRKAERYAENNRKPKEQRWAETKAYNLSRFRVIKVKRDSEEGWISNVEARDEKGEVVSIYASYSWSPYEHITDINKIVDGSGYVVKDYREDLADRLKTFKAKKANQAYAQIDNSNKVAMINALVSARKTILDAQFENVKTSEEVYDFISTLYSFRNVLEDVEYFSKHTAEKTYASIEQSEKDYQNLIKKLTA